MPSMANCTCMTRNKKRGQTVVATKKPVAEPQHLPWHESWARWLIFALLALLPLVVLSPEHQAARCDGYAASFVDGAGGRPAGGGRVVGLGLARRIASHRHLLDIPVLLFLLAALFTGIRGAYPHVSLLSTLWAQEFTAVPALGIMVALYFGIKEFIHGKKWVEDAGVILVAAGGLKPSLRSSTILDASDCIRHSVDRTARIVWWARWAIRCSPAPISPCSSRWRSASR